MTLIQKISQSKLVHAVLIAAFWLMAMSVVSAQDFTQGYSSEETLLRGSIVGLAEENSNSVATVNTENAGDTLGVVVRDTDSAVTITDDRTGVFVVTTGRFEVLVSSINGEIATGDWLSVSSINGVAMVSDESQRFVVGTALEDVDFSDSANILSQTTVTDSTGNEITVGIARVLAEISIGPNPNRVDDRSAPDFLISFSETIAGKPVAAVRIYAGLAVMLIATIIAGSLLYSAVKSSIISIGRNPLSKKSVLAGLAQVVIISLIIFISGLVAVYLILKI